MDTPVDAAESFRRAELRLRVLLLGDGIETVGLARSDDLRARVTADLRRMRVAFDALVDERKSASQVEVADARIAELEADLLRLAAERADATPVTPDAPEALLTPAEAAHELGVSTSSLYRAVRRGSVHALRPTSRRGGPMRIPASEVRRLAQGTAPTT